MGGHLSRNHRAAEGELDWLYVQGFGPITCGKIEQRLLFIFPDHHPEDPYPRTNVQAVATFLLSHTSPNNASTQEPAVQSPHAYAHAHIPAPPLAPAPSGPYARATGQSHVKWEVFDMDTFMS